MEEFVVLLVALELGLFTVCVVAGFAMGRRSHFWARVLLGCLAAPALVLSVGSLVSEHALGFVFFAIFYGGIVHRPSRVLPEPGSPHRAVLVRTTAGAQVPIGPRLPASLPTEAFLSRIVTRRGFG
jgi:hypothetical protein